MSMRERVDEGCVGVSHNNATASGRAYLALQLLLDIACGQALPPCTPRTAFSVCGHGSAHSSNLLASFCVFQDTCFGCGLEMVPELTCLLAKQGLNAY